MPTTTGYRTITYPANGALNWFSTFESFSQAITNHLDGLASTIVDTNGDEILKFVPASGAVNYTQLTSTATGTGPTLSAQGGDTNIDFKISPKGSGSLLLDGPIVVSGTADINGNTTLTGNLTATGTLTLTGAASISGSGSVGGALGVTGALTVSGASDLQGACTLDGLSWPTADGSAGQFLKTDGAGNLSFAAPTDTGATGINDLSDVTISSVADNEILQYNSGTSLWINQTLSEAGIQAQDVVLDDLAGLTLTKGDILVYDGSNLNKLDSSTDGLFLSLDSATSTGLAWDTPASVAGQLELLNSATASSGTSVDFTSGFSTTYSSYILIGRKILTDSDGDSMEIYLSNNGGSSYHSSGYKCNTVSFEPGDTSPTTSETLTAFAFFETETTNDIGAAAGEEGSLVCWIHNMADAEKTHLQAQFHFIGNAGKPIQLLLMGLYDTAEANNALRIAMFNGNISGTFKLYGVKNS